MFCNDYGVNLMSEQIKHLLSFSPFFSWTTQLKCQNYTNPKNTVARQNDKQELFIGDYPI